VARNRKRARGHDATGHPIGDAEGAQSSSGEPADEDATEPEQMATEYASAQPEDDGDDGLAPGRHPASVGPRESLPARAVGFVRGSWRELQRVQWPDRRQVAQATGVVLGFVIVAGCFLGVADLVASKLVNLILK
jgi:preprotein translocase subunit SecE